MTPIIKEAKRICKDNGYFLIGTPIEAYHKYHFHPLWTKEDIIELGNKFGEIIDLEKFKDHWLFYVRNI